MEDYEREVLRRELESAEDEFIADLMGLHREQVTLFVRAKQGVLTVTADYLGKSYTLGWHDIRPEEVL